MRSPISPPRSRPESCLGAAAHPSQRQTASTKQWAVRRRPGWLQRPLRAALRPTVAALWDARVTGIDHIPRSGPAIIVANKLSFIDSVFLMTVMPRRVLALRTGAPIIPIGIIGTERIQPPGTSRPRCFLRRDIRIGSPIEVAQRDQVGRRAQADILRDEFLAALAHLSSPQPAAEVERL